MPKLSYLAPKYAYHKASGQAVVRINGKLVYLGPWGSRESKDRYKQAVTKWADDQDRQAAAVAVVAESQPESSATLVELLAAYLDHADGYYRKNGRPTGTVSNLRPILRLLKEMFGTVLVADIPGREIVRPIPDWELQQRARREPVQAIAAARIDVDARAEGRATGIT